MGRPREHDEATANALLAAGERLAQQHGLRALSARRVATACGTTTRAVYSLFGSMDGLVAALGAHAFDVLGAAVADLPETSDPAADLVEAGLAFRTFAMTHRSLFQIAIQRTEIKPELAARFRPAAEQAMVHLQRRLARLEATSGLGGRSVAVAAAQFHALCEGLAVLELRGILIPPDTTEFWRSALRALVAGFSVAPSGRRRQPRRRTLTA
jgi:AcrR family transcriptional regulator